MNLPPQQESIADIEEGKLVCKLVTDHSWRDAILGIHGMPSAPRIIQQVPLTTAPGSPEGDIDILLVPPHWPSEATAIQVKRIKFSEAAFREGGQPNKLGDFQKGVDQANLLADLGFHQVYIFVFVVVDSRTKNQGQISYEGLSSKQRSLVESTISTRDLHPDVGLVVYTLVQPMDHPPLTTGTSAGSLKRLATPRQQPRELTHWLTQVLG